MNKRSEVIEIKEVVFEDARYGGFGIGFDFVGFGEIES